MEIKERKKLRYILIISLIALSLLPCRYIFSLADDTLDYSFTAVLYDTSGYNTASGTELTKERVTISSWQYNTSKYLQIDPTVPIDGSTYMVKVELPQEFYIVGTELLTPAGYQSVDFVKNDSIAINTNGTYSLNTYSGTATYTLANMVESGTIQLEIRYDNVLWDKQANSQLTPDGVYPIKVSLIKQTETKTTTLETLSVSKATSKESWDATNAIYTDMIS